MNEIKVKFKKVHEKAQVPVYMRPNDCCCDLFSVEEVTIVPGQRKLIDTGIAIELPVGFEAQIRPRSGNAWKQGVTVLNAPGTIDSDYIGNIKVLLINHGTNYFKIEIGDRIAQMKFSPVYTGTFIEVDELGGTERGAGGFGSTGK